ncbi:hypothetical protein [Variovorax sp. DXTD-1]|uniref:hypothetical protein n=1 Tax=Variovorax sp. DXTD-1 TaxID=2495592 RepID=UPI00163C0AA0|nr:hypothetical protein [Variovorax sp. DXTD-1]
MSRASTPRRLRSVAAPTPAPIGGLMDPRFVYVPAAATDIRKTFERIRAQGPLLKGKP